jgi:hypothetical protein
MENGVEGGRPFRGGAANESTNEWGRLLFAWKHHLIRFSIVRAIVGECQALSSDGKPAVAPIAELLVHGQVAGRRSARIKLSACAAICDVDGTVSVHTTAVHVLNSAQTFVVVHMTSHHEVDLPPAKNTNVSSKEGRTVQTHSTKSRCHVRASSTSSLSLGHEVKGGLQSRFNECSGQGNIGNVYGLPVKMNNDPRSNAALHSCHVLQKELNLRLLWMLTAQHYDVHEAVRERVPGPQSHAPHTLNRARPAAPHVRQARELRKTLQRRNTTLAAAVITLRTMEMILVSIDLVIADANLHKGIGAACAGTLVKKSGVPSKASSSQEAGSGQSIAPISKAIPSRMKYHRSQSSFRPLH